MDTETGLALVRRLGGADLGLAVAVTTRADGRPLASVVNAAVMEHPLGGGEVVAFVARGDAAKLRHLRARPAATLVFRSGWEWVAVEGPVELAGPDDPLDGVDAERLRLLLREVFTSAGGDHDDFDEYDRVMAAERRTAVLVRPDRVYSNPGAS